MTNSEKRFVTIVLIIAAVIFALGFFIGRRSCNCNTQDTISIKEAKKQYRDTLSRLVRENYRLVVLDSSLEGENRKIRANRDDMQQREADLKYQLAAINQSRTKYKYLYESLYHYDTFNSRDIQRYFADSIGADSVVRR